MLQALGRLLNIYYRRLILILVFYLRFILLCIFHWDYVNINS